MAKGSKGGDGGIGGERRVEGEGEDGLKGEGELGREKGRRLRGGYTSSDIRERSGARRRWRCWRRKESRRQRKGSGKNEGLQGRNKMKEGMDGWNEEGREEEGYTYTIIGHIVIMYAYIFPLP